MLPMITKEEARLCASVVTEVACAQGMVRDPGAIGSVNAAVARLQSRHARPDAAFGSRHGAYPIRRQSPSNIKIITLSRSPTRALRSKMFMEASAGLKR